jgi:hypothetical protein
MQMPTLETSGKPALLLNKRAMRFALTSEEIASACIHIGNTEGFHAVATKPGKPDRIVIRQIRSGLCAVDMHFGPHVWTCESGRVEAKRTAARLGAWLGAPVFNIKRNRPDGSPGSLVRCN